MAPWHLHFKTPFADHSTPLKLLTLTKEGNSIWSFFLKFNVFLDTAENKIEFFKISDMAKKYLGIRKMNKFTEILEIEKIEIFKNEKLENIFLQNFLKFAHSNQGSIPIDFFHFQ